MIKPITHYLWTEFLEEAGESLPHNFKCDCARRRTEPNLSQHDQIGREVTIRDKKVFFPACWFTHPGETGPSVLACITTALTALSGIEISALHSRTFYPDVPCEVMRYGAGIRQEVLVRAVDLAAADAGAIWAEKYGLKYSASDPDDAVKTYFIHSPEQAAIKIGISENPKNRLAALATSNPSPLKMIATLNGNHEYSLHRKFEKHRLRGEWFTAVPVLKWLEEIRPVPAAAEVTA
jgi:hypothetical protein